MKNRLSIKYRIFLSFSITIIIIVNIFAIFLFNITKQNLLLEDKKNITNKFETIKTLIDGQKTGIFVLPTVEIEKIHNLGFYFYLGNNDKNLQKNYKLGFIKNSNNLIFRGDYFGYNIILGKKLNEILNFEKKFYKILIFLNIFLIFLSFVISYFIRKFSLLPLYKLSDYLNNYNYINKNNMLTNNYKNTEIGILTDSINKFINQNNNILEIQKSFIQDVSHELKTPLMQIESNIELIEGKIKEEIIKNKIEQIKNSTKDINQIISNLGFILRGEEVLKNKEIINIYDYFKNFVKTYEVLANKKNIKIEIIKKYDLILKNNSYFLDRLFGNLLSNAIHYNNGNNIIKIIINKNKIIIKDEGIGIEKEELNQIFSRFYRNKNSTLFYNSGNGLGLVIVKKILNMFGWKIEIKSEKGVGSEIIVLFHIIS